jgi:hypothetical protein
MTFETVATAPVTPVLRRRQASEKYKINVLLHSTVAAEYKFSSIELFVIILSLLNTFIF